LYQLLFSLKIEQLLATFFGGTEAHPEIERMMVAIITFLLITTKESNKVINVKLKRNLVIIMVKKF